MNRPPLADFLFSWIIILLFVGARDIIVVIMTRKDGKNMTPEDFDIDFDFDKEYGFAGEADKHPEDDDFDLDAALARELGPDFDALFEQEYAASQAALNAELAYRREQAAIDEEDADDDNPFLGGFSLLDDDEDDQDEAEDAEESDEAEETAEPADTADAAEEVPNDGETEDLSAIFAAVSAAHAEEEMPEEEPQPFRRERRQSDRKGLDLSAITRKIDVQAIKDKVDTKAIGEKFSGAGQVIAENARNFVDALKECKPGKMDKKQKRRFKNDVLPILIGGTAFIMCLIFIIGSLSRSLNSEERLEAARRESIAQAEAEAAAAAEITNTLDTAALKATQYDYQGAIETLDGYRDPETGRELTEEMTAAREAYSAAMSDLVVWDDPTAITNLSFHALIEDPDRAYSDPVYANSYRNKFITTAQFSAILEELYSGGYVLVNLESCIAASTDDAGNTTYTTKPIYLPEGKTPIMITETLVNYFDYMTDGDGDGAPDADGAGFANRLVISAGEIKAEYIDALGNTQVGDYDLVPILNTFVDAHPDFSYRGAKAILAVTGDEGVFGWRTNKDPNLVDGAKDIAEVLRANGYQIASNSYGNLDYGTTATSGISSDLDKWVQEIEPILGEVDIMIIARGGSIDAPEKLENASARFALLHDNGFHYILDASDTPAAVLTADFFYQSRLMVVGSNMSTGLYDAYFSITE